MSYEKEINILGFDKVCECIPFSVAEVRLALSKGDEYLNTLPIAEWDRAVGISENRRTGYITHFASKLKSLCKANGVSLAPAQMVCMLKSCARKLAEMEG